MENIVTINAEYNRNSENYGTSGQFAHAENNWHLHFETPWGIAEVASEIGTIGTAKDKVATIHYKNKFIVIPAKVEIIKEEKEDEKECYNAFTNYYAEVNFIVDLNDFEKQINEHENKPAGMDWDAYTKFIR